VCDPVSAGMFAIQAVGQVGEHRSKVQGVHQRNRARLQQWDNENENYLTQVMLDNDKYKNDVLVAEIEEDRLFAAMQNQWNEYDEQLDKLFSDSDFAMQKQLIEMYENEYAGTQTGATAARRAGKSAKELGFANAKRTADLLLNKEELARKKETKRLDAEGKIGKLYEAVRFPPVHGHAPVPPEMEAQPSSASLYLNLAGSALSSYGFSKLTNAKNPLKKGAKVGGKTASGVIPGISKTGEYISSQPMGDLGKYAREAQDFKGVIGR